MIFHWGFGGGATKLSYRWLSNQNWKVFVSWRYDFLGIVTTMPELAKTEQEATEVFRNRTDNVRQPDTVRQI